MKFTVLLQAFLRFQPFWELTFIMRMRHDAGKFSASGDHYRVDKEIFVRFLNRGVKLLPKFLNENDFFKFTSKQWAGRWSTYWLTDWNIQFQIVQVKVHV